MAAENRRAAQDGQDGRPEATSAHVRRAEAGDAASLEWVVERLTPFLLAQASYRLGPMLRTLYDPEDLVNDVWAITLPRLSELPERDGRTTPVLLRFLATTLIYRVSDLVKKHLARAGPAADSPRVISPSAALDRLPADASGVITRTVRREREGQLAAALEQLDPQDREVLLLRGIEQNANSTVAMLLGLTQNAVSMRYKRALKRLRQQLPASVLDDLGEE